MTWLARVLSSKSKEEPSAGRHVTTKEGFQISRPQPAADVAHLPQPPAPAVEGPPFQTLSREGDTSSITSRRSQSPHSIGQPLTPTRISNISLQYVQREGWKIPQRDDSLKRLQQEARVRGTPENLRVGTDPIDPRAALSSYPSPDSSDEPSHSFGPPFHLEDETTNHHFDHGFQEIPLKDEDLNGPLWKNNSEQRSPDRENCNTESRSETIAPFDCFNTPLQRPEHTHQSLSRSSRSYSDRDSDNTSMVWRGDSARAPSSTQTESKRARKATVWCLGIFLVVTTLSAIGAVAFSGYTFIEFRKLKSALANPTSSETKSMTHISTSTVKSSMTTGGASTMTGHDMSSTLTHTTPMTVTEASTYDSSSSYLSSDISTSSGTHSSSLTEQLPTRLTKFVTITSVLHQTAPSKPTATPEMSPDIEKRGDILYPRNTGSSPSSERGFPAGFSTPKPHRVPTSNPVSMGSPFPVPRETVSTTIPIHTPTGPVVPDNEQPNAGSGGTDARALGFFGTCLWLLKKGCNLWKRYLDIINTVHILVAIICFIILLWMFFYIRHNFWDRIKDWVSHPFEKIKDFFEHGGKELEAVMKKITDQVKDKVKDELNDLRSEFEKKKNDAEDLGHSVYDKGKSKGILSGILGARTLFEDDWSDHVTLLTASTIASVTTTGSVHIPRETPTTTSATTSALSPESSSSDVMGTYSEDEKSEAGYRFKVPDVFRWIPN